MRNRRRARGIIFLLMPRPFAGAVQPAGDPGRLRQTRGLQLPHDLATIDFYA